MNPGSDTGGGGPDNPGNGNGTAAQPGCGVLTPQKAFVMFHYTPEATPDETG